MIKNELNQKLQLTCIVCALLSGTNYLHANGKWSDRHEKEIIPTVKKLTEEGIHIMVQYEIPRENHFLE